MTWTRRRFLNAAGGIGLVVASGGLHLLNVDPPGQTGALLRSTRPRPDRFGVPLPVPTIARPTSTAEGTDRYEIVQQAADVEILPGLSTRIWGYDGQFPGPTIRARRHRPVTVVFANHLAVPTVIHLHGGLQAPDSDGYPTDVIMPLPAHAGPGADRAMMPGEQAVGLREYRYPVDQRAATLWYHDHTMDFTGPNVYRGLAGLFLVSDDEEDAIGLPSGDREIPLVICDRAFDGDGALLYPALSPDQQFPGVADRYVGGVLGDVLLVNGAPWPHHEVAATSYRLRVLNASNARRYELALDPPPPDGAPSFVQVGTDGGLLERPLRRTTLTVAPAERLDVIVDFGAYPVGTSVTLRNGIGNGPMGDVMRFDVVRAGPDDVRVPDHLSTHEPISRSDAVQTRTFRFLLDAGTAGFGGDRSDDDSHDAGHGARHGRDGPSHRWLVNDRPFSVDHDVAEPRRGDVEIWRFMGDLHHPVHLHAVHFKVLERNGRDIADGDHGWKDTIDLLTGHTTEVIARFDAEPGRYVMHCHNLEHEDMAMMANFTVR